MDCMQGMEEFPDKYFDLAIVDPPYGRKEHGGRNRSGYVRQKNGSKIFVKMGSTEIGIGIMIHLQKITSMNL